MSESPPVTILLASYNGRDHLAQQLDSIAAQEYRAWRIIISDDGSTDDSRAISSAFRDRWGDDRVLLVDGPRRGPTQNFLHLVEVAPINAALAFSDQDDVWLPKKLSRAMGKLPERRGAALYCSRTLVCDGALQNRRPSRLFSRPHSWQNALVQSCTPGNTTVLNTQAAGLLKQSVEVASRYDLEAHDWWAYQVITGAGGSVIFDAEPTLLYRQHGANAIGRNDTVASKMKRVASLMDGKYGEWLAANSDALAELGDLITPENREILRRFQKMLRLPGPAALRELFGTGLYRHTTAGNMALIAATVAGRIRRTD